MLEHKKKIQKLFNIKNQLNNEFGIKSPPKVA